MPKVVIDSKALERAAFKSAFRSYLSIVGVLVGGVSVFNLTAHIFSLNISGLLMPIIAIYKIAFHRPLQILLGFMGWNPPSFVKDVIVIYVLAYSSVARFYLTLPISNPGSGEEMTQWEVLLNEHIPYIRICIALKAARAGSWGVHPRWMEGANQALTREADWRKTLTRRAKTVRSVALIIFMTSAVIAWPLLLYSRIKNRYFVRHEVWGTNGGPSYSWSQRIIYERDFDAYNSFIADTMLDARWFYLYQLIAMFAAFAFYAALNAFAA